MRLARLPQLLAVPVDLGIADVVADESVRAHVEQHGSLRESVLAGPARGVVDGLDVLAVHVPVLHAVRLGAAAELLDGQRELLARGCRLGPAVVLEHEDRRHAPELGEVHGLVEGARIRGAVAEERHSDAPLALQLERERGADDRPQPAADDGVRAHVPALDVVEVHRAAEAV